MWICQPLVIRLSVIFDLLFSFQGKDTNQTDRFAASLLLDNVIVILGIPAVAVPTVNPDNNQHSPNENIRLGNYIDGIKTITAILMQKL